MQAKQQEVQTVLNGLSDDVKELMAQRDSETVSYTHLDVYKRQVVSHVGVVCNPLRQRQDQMDDVLRDSVGLSLLHI